MKNSLIVAVVVALVVGLLIGWYVGASKTANNLSNQAKESTASLKEQGLQMAMRKLWEDHITWTRLYILSAASNSKSADSDAARLLKNQEDIGNAIKPYYGEDGGNKLTQLLKDHITGAVAIIKAAKANDQSTLSQANDKWYANGNDIADFLSKANPNWPNDQTRNMMKEHLDLTKQEAVDILGNKYEESITDYDQVHNQILSMADMLSDGIVKQFPDKF